MADETYHQRALERFDRKHKVSTTLSHNGEPCWEWHGSIAATGYGIFGYDHGMFLAHRFSYERSKGPIPKGLQIDHLCRVKHCINPAHLEAVTSQENMKRLGAEMSARRTHCVHGHEYTPENTMMGKRGRTCRLCNLLNCRGLAFIKAMTNPPKPPRNANREKTHCPKGHPYSGKNLLLGKGGGRSCRTCNLAWQQAKRDAIPKPPKPLITHCPNGHEFTPENSAYYKSWRYCRACKRERSVISNAKSNAKRRFKRPVRADQSSLF